MLASDKAIYELNTGLLLEEAFTKIYHMRQYQSWSWISLMEGEVDLWLLLWSTKPVLTGLILR